MENGAFAPKFSIIFSNTKFIDVSKASKGVIMELRVKHLSSEWCTSDNVKLLYIPVEGGGIFIFCTLHVKASDKEGMQLANLLTSQ